VSFQWHQLLKDVGSWYLWIVRIKRNSFHQWCTWKDRVLTHVFIKACTHTSMDATVLQLFGFCLGNTGEPVPKETFTHSHLLWSSIVQKTKTSLYSGSTTLLVCQYSEQICAKQITLLREWSKPAVLCDMSHKCSMSALHANERYKNFPPNDIITSTMDGSSDVHNVLTSQHISTVHTSAAVC